MSVGGGPGLVNETYCRGEEAVLEAWGSSLEQIAGRVGGVGHKVAWALQKKNTAEKSFPSVQQNCRVDVFNTLNQSWRHWRSLLLLNYFDCSLHVAAFYCAEAITTARPSTCTQQQLCWENSDAPNLKKKKKKAPCYLNDCLHGCLCICGLTRGKQEKKRLFSKWNTFYITQPSMTKGLRLIT